MRGVSAKSVCAVGLLVLLWLVFDGFKPERIFFTDDIALSMAVGKTALGGFPVLLGPPSHVGGRHLGGAYYWYVIITQLLSGGDDFKSLFLFTVWKLLAVLFICCLVWFLAGRRGRWWGCAGVLLAFCSPGYVSIIRTAWHNHFLLIPSVLVWAAFLAVLMRGLRCFPVFVLCSSILLQSHFSTAPMLLGLGAALMIFVWRRENGESWRRLFHPGWPGMSLYLAAALSWLPLVIYELRFPGSFGELLQARARHTSLPSGLNAALEEIGNFWRVVFPGLRGRWVFGGLLLLCAPLYAAWKEQKTKTIAYTLGGVVLVFGSYAFFLSRLGAPLYSSYLYGALPVPALLAGLCAGSIADCYKALTAFWRGRAVLVASIAGLIVIIAQTLVFDPDRRARDFVSYHSFEAARQMAEVIALDRQADENQAAALHAAALSRFNRDAVLYFLGPAFHGQMQYWDLLREFPRGYTEPSRAYLLSCPQIYSAQIREFEAGLGPDWQFVKNIDVSSCALCRKCLLRRYQRSAAQYQGDLQKDPTHGDG